MLNMFGLSQSVCQPTHKRGRIIDCVLFRPQDNVVQSTSLTQELSSDHLCVVCDLHVEASPAPVIYKEARNLRALDIAVFKQDLRTTVSPTLCPSIEQLDSTLRAVLDRHAPVTRCRVKDGRSAPSYSGVREELRQAQKEIRCTPWYSSVREELRQAKEETLCPLVLQC
eukprot:TRINITY_DN37831_c0_g1_i1.p1 TRINITY_DN37831_c0_g1~~TRINITY_DN37831_c0_g1_i1.p1  ORF type:complete len:169 (+),score=20.69 TRINITY_DN37831_c0_g1_i1:3-509(+)